MNQALHNAHLEGDTFLWEGNSIGVLLCHGFTATTSEVRLLGNFLREHGYTVAGPLLPGHGTSPQELNRCRWQDWAAALESAYQDLAARCEKVFVAGESMGGLLSLYLTSQHSEIVAVMTYSAALKLPARFYEIVIPLFANIVPSIKKKATPPNAADARWQGYMQNPLKAAAELLKLQSVVRGVLPQIEQPILIVQGKLDTSVDATAPGIIYDAVGSVDKHLHWFDQSTHCILIDQEWEDVAHLTLDFLKRQIESEDVR